MVKMTPAAMELPAEAPVWTMLFSRMCPPPKTRNTAMETTAAGIADAIVMPANNPRYALAAARTIARPMERITARAVSCGADVFGMRFLARSEFNCIDWIESCPDTYNELSVMPDARDAPSGDPYRRLLVGSFDQSFRKGRDREHH